MPRIEHNAKINKTNSDNTRLVMEGIHKMADATAAESETITVEYDSVSDTDSSSAKDSVLKINAMDSA